MSTEPAVECITAPRTGRPYQRIAAPPDTRYGPREVETLRLLATGITYDDIAERMDVSIDTIKGHLKRIYRKLGAENGPHAVSIAIGRGMIAAESSNPGTTNP